jgi:hypothetical protein
MASEEATMPEKLISELPIPPDNVRKGEFALNLSKGVIEPLPAWRRMHEHAS